MFRPALRSLPKTTAALRPAATRTFASASGPTFNWEDPLASKNLFTEEELAIGETAERYCQERMLPRVLRMLPPTMAKYVDFLTLLTFVRRGLP